MAEQVTVFEPFDRVFTMSQNGKVTEWHVATDGTLKEAL